MDQRLVAWARSVKARHRLVLPTIWLFTDPERMGDVLAIIGRLPPGLCGVVFRHDDVPGRARLARNVARLCRARRLALTISGSWRLAASLGAGQHIRPAQDERARLRGRIITAPAHDARDIRRAAKAGAMLIFLSPVFPTRTHPGAHGLGAVRWAGLAREAGVPVLALGGVDGLTARRLAGARCAGAGAIGALSGATRGCGPVQTNFDKRTRHVAGA